MSVPRPLAHRLAGPVLLGLLLSGGAGLNPAVPGARAANCAQNRTGLVPLTELGAGGYKGQNGGLYPGGGNAAPPAQRALAQARAAEIGPRDPGGAPDPAGRVVLLSIGMSNTTQEFSAFVRQAAGDPSLNGALSIVDGAQGGQTAADIRDPEAQFWRVIDRRLADAGSTAAQVQALWLKSANRQPGADRNPDTLPAARRLADDIQAALAVAQARFPNLKLVFLSSRIYAGYASTALNPEPYAYESALALRWLIERQMAGEAGLDPAGGAPALLWGPYLWADGLEPRADGLTWACADFQADGTHPSEGGRAKVAGLLMDFFRTDPASRAWFLAEAPASPPPPGPSPIPTLPAPTAPTPTPSPGPPRPSASPVPVTASPAAEPALLPLVLRGESGR